MELPQTEIPHSTPLTTHNVMRPHGDVAAPRPYCRGGWGAIVVALLRVAAASPCLHHALRTRTACTFVTTGTCYLDKLNSPRRRLAKCVGSVARPPSSETSVRPACTCSSQQFPVAMEEDVTVVLDNGTLQQAVDIDNTRGSSSARRPRRHQLLGTVAPMLLAATTACSHAATAAVTGGRIGGGGYTVPDHASSAPPVQQQRYQAPPQRYDPPTNSAGDIYGSDGSRVHISYSGKQGRRRGSRFRFNQDVGDVTSNSITAGDVVMVGGVSAGVMALQRYNRKRFLEEGHDGYGSASPKALPASARGLAKGGRETAVVTTLQLSMFCDRQGGRGDLLGTLEKLSQTADVNSPRGLSALVNEVCLTLLRSESDWIGATGGIKEYPPDGLSGGRTQRDKKANPRSRAKRDFNRAVTRERSKWERETVSNTPARGFSSSTVPGWRGSNGATGGTYAVVTLMIAWAGLRSVPPKSKTRRDRWFWQINNNRDGDDRDTGFSVANRKSAIALLEWLGDEAAEGRGEDVLDVEVLWTPADPDDSLHRDDLDAKWPELREL